MGVELFQFLDALFLPSHGAQDVVAGAHHLFRQAALLFDFRKRAQRFVIFLLGQVNVQQFINDGVLFREGFHEGFVLAFAFINLVL